MANQWIQHWITEDINWIFKFISLWLSNSNIELRAEIQVIWNISENKNAYNLKNVLWYCFDEETFYLTLIIVIEESVEISS